MQELERKLGYRFRSGALLAEALRHSSYANEHRGAESVSNERLEFLGDSVLGFVTAEYLFARHPDSPEGELTRIRAALVCEESLHEVAQKLELARRKGMPVVIHDRDADEDVIRLLAELPCPGMIHRFFSRAEYGFQLLEMGLSLGIGPAVTYSNAGELVQVVRQMPLERLLLETDAPFLPSARFEGKRATSDMIADVCEVVAQIRGDVTPQEVALAARENARRMFGI